MTTTEQRPSVGGAAEWTLPPGWEALRSENNKIYYWNKKTGDTTWKFPEKEALEHVSMVRRHTYENVGKRSTGATPTSSTPTGNMSTATTPSGATPGGTPTGIAFTSDAFPIGLANTQTSLGFGASGPNATSVMATPTGGRATPTGGRATPTGLVLSPSKKHGYENVQLVEGNHAPKSIPRAHTIASRSSGSHLPHYEEVEEMKPPPPLRTTSCSSPSYQPANPTPNSSHISLASPPPIPGHQYLEQSVEVSPAPIQHQMSSTGTEYAVVARKQTRMNRKQQEQKQQQQQQQLQQQVKERVVDGKGVAPPIPLRAFQRMSSRENLADFPNEQGSGNDHQSGSSSPAAAGGQGAGPRSLVNSEALLDGEVSLDPHDPQPYEVACVSPRPPDLADATAQGSQETPKSEDLEPPEAESADQDPPEVDPPYEEIEKDEQLQDDGEGENGYSRVRLRPKRATAAMSSGDRGSGVEKSYDLPFNSRKLQALNVTLRRGERSSSTSCLPPSQQSVEYSKVGFSKEALLLRSGVTLRRNQRESLTSMASFSTLDLETGEVEGGGNINQEEGAHGQKEEGKGSDSSCEEEGKAETREAVGNEDGVENFKMVVPPRRPPAWVTYQRRPHAYEDIMGAVQENMDWDDSDLVGGMALSKGAGFQSCEMIKIDESSLPKPKPRAAHKYEEVELAQPVKSGGEGLPAGWVRMKDEQHREYYWHIPSGKTQYAHPLTGVNVMTTPTAGLEPEQAVATPPSYKAQPFPAMYLGCMGIDEQLLVPGQCVKAVHNCIAKMTTITNYEQQSKNHKEVLLAVKGLTLAWLHPQNHAPIVTQPINRIRVWGIGLDNDRDFGYVARDTVTRKHLCHAFRCSVPARAVAHLLLESHQQDRQKNRRSTSSTSGGPTPASPAAKDAPGGSGGAGVQASSRRRSYQDYYERISCTYIGSCEVLTSQGMELINEAVTRLSKTMDSWQDVSVDITTSSITICNLKSGRVLGDHRVRFLCFLGIAHDDRFCGYILDNGELKGERFYRFHGFMKEPNTDRLCLALHSACQARYKRVLQAQAIRHAANQQGGGGDGRSKSVSSALFQRLGSLKKSKKLTLSGGTSPPATPTSVVEGKTFVVQYLGCLPVSNVDGLDTVRPVVQELATSPVAGATTLVDFTVSPSGLAFSNYRSSTSSSQSVSRCEFPVRNITYVVKIRTYFAFIARDGGSYVCHVFMESKVDAGTIVTTIQNMLAPPSRSSPATPTSQQK